MKPAWIKPLLLTFGLVALLGLAGTGWIIVTGLQDHPGKADVGIVFGTKVARDGTPSSRLQARLDETIHCFQAGDFAKIIVTGDTDKYGHSEPQIMAHYLREHGVPPGQIIVDSSGSTTFYSARDATLITQQMHFNSVFLITQYFHIPRATLAMQRFGVKTIYSAHAPFFELRDLYSAPRECVAYLRYFFHDYTLPTSGGK